MGERREAGAVERLNQKARGEAHGLLHVIVFPRIPGFIGTLRLSKDRNEPGRRFEEGLIGVRAQLFEISQPALASAALVEGALISLCGFPDLTLEFGAANAGKVPGLMIGSARGRARRQQALLNDRPGHGPIRERPKRTPSGQGLVSRLSPSEERLVVHGFVARQRHCFVG